MTISSLRIPMILLALCAAPVVGWFPQVSEQEKPGPAGIALTIGLNSVDPTHYGASVSPLMACQRDAEDMATIAKSRGFATTTLLTTQATRKNFFVEMDKAIASLKTGDIFMLSYSGHGSHVPDQNGDEIDNKDETWCLYDGQVIDDELAGLWVKFAPGVRIVLLSDSCYSGTVAKFLEYKGALDVPSSLDVDVTKALKERFVALGDLKTPLPATQAASPVRTIPENVAQRVFRDNRDSYEKRGKETPSQKESEKRTEATVLLISGCQDNQLSWDGPTNGVFTAALKDVWRGGTFSGSYRDFQEAILMTLPSNQSPNYYVFGACNRAFEAQVPFTR